MSEAGAISRTRSPLSRSAGEGPGVRASRSAGEGPGVRASRSAGEGPGVRASRSAGEEGGIIPPDLLPSPPSAHPQGEKGGMSEAGAISRTRSPLSRSAGEGPGVRASRSAGEEGGIIPPDLPPSPPSAHPQGEKGGMSEAGAISRTRSPLSRSAGEGLGVRASRSAGEGMGVRGRTVRSQQEIRVVDHPLR